MKRLAGLTLGALLWTSNGFGFCRATTCNRADVKQHCMVDASTQCTTSGLPLHWASGCMAVSVQRDGAPLADISAADAEASVRRAFDTWLGADCGSGAPSFAVEIGAQVSCDIVEYSSDHRNANIVMFREDKWPYEGGEDALGVTWLSFAVDDPTGEIWDADIELNAVAEPLSVGKPKLNQVDLDSLITHEVGHLLGLGHTLAAGATMEAGYTLGSTELRSLSDDDVAGICAIYPPERALDPKSCGPRHGFSELCAANQVGVVEPVDDTSNESASAKGCALRAPSRANAKGEIVGLTLLGAAARRRKRRRWARFSKFTSR